MALKFYYDLMSQPSRTVYMFLKLNKISFEDKKVALRKGMYVQLVQSPPIIAGAYMLYK